MSRRTALWNRWLGVGLASCLAVVTLGLAFTGRLALYINPSSNWFAIPMAVLLLVGAGLSFLLPLGAEEDHGHDHGHGSTGMRDAAGTASGILVDTPLDQRSARRVAEDPRPRAQGGGSGEGAAAHAHARTRTGRPAAVLAAAGGAAASLVALSILLLPPASLSAEIAQTRDVGAAPLFAGSDVVNLAVHGDTTAFGVGDWASVFATATNPDAFVGDTVTITGFVTPGDDGTFDLTRLVITHCVIDAQPARVPIATGAKSPATGVWVSVAGTVRSTASGTLQIDATKVTPIAEPKDPYEY
ncbi:TIGR03943 family protein [Microbacterium sp. KR10-403]|uniref:TIGR03943 family putative permease subunit n=1 Tax=Microbacterium sp. KR10-403 TaxID=3158581 RepID=UPI0032E3FC26